MSYTRNQESRINEAAIVKAPRSKFDYSQEASFDFKMGYIVPFFCECTVMPGDQFKLDMNAVIRLANPTVYPIMTPLYLDVYAFFTADRLIWDHIKEFYGENPDGAWTLQTEYTKPKLVTDENGFEINTIADYIYGSNLGVKTECDARPIRSMNQVYNDWFRNQAVIAPIQFEHGDADTTYDKTDSSKGGTCYKIAKYGDLFTRTLPTALKGDEVTIPLGKSAPVYGTGNSLTFQSPGTLDMTTEDDITNLFKMRFPGSGINSTFLAAKNTNNSNKTYQYSEDTEQGGIPVTTYNIDNATAPEEGTWTNSAYIGLGEKRFLNGQDSGAYTDLTEATGAGMNQLIEAMAIYDILYRMGIGGTRYTEIIRNFWGVQASDARLQRSEYLGGFSFPIDMREIPQTSASTANSPQANVAALSHTSFMNKHLINKSFVEHGTILIMLAVRQRHYYSQGLERCYSTFRKFDNYMPPLANLGPMEVRKKELYVSGIEETDNETFGFQEAWYWLRGIRPSKVMGHMRPNATETLAAWHLADDFDSAPVLSQEFIEETDQYLDRALYVQSEQEQNITQFIAATFIHGKVTRVMPTSSIPALRTFF